jgi:hypothetical protein
MWRDYKGQDDWNQLVFVLGAEDWIWYETTVQLRREQ